MNKKIIAQYKDIKFTHHFIEWQSNNIDRLILQHVKTKEESSFLLYCYDVYLKEKSGRIDEEYFNRNLPQV